MLYQLLIVDDEKLVADSMADYVDWASTGFEVCAVAYGVEEAMDILRKKQIDVMLTDIIMGDGTGLELIERAINVNNDLKCVILSGHEEFSYAKKAIRLGVYDYLVKPVDFDELEKLFLNLCQQLKGRNAESGEKKPEILENSQDKSEGAIVNHVKAYVETHYGEELSLNILADQVYVHPTYLSILFKKKTGSNFKDYVTRVRIEKAKEMLKDLSLRIVDISGKVGYESSKHFSKIFKELTGMTPKDYRNNL
ncbi:MAG: response regulator [Bacillota bacterium]|nr:response regulator [Bacillota bacterium]